ncbi:RagB/SusD family nutrient uptake outer membrane protein [Butyricimonas sp.]|uniref:RagB/SusD family nutrient uptake outer membrane protein n=1 Tax=Butyricimonas sp. TaxID=1969738 RepID=UPI0025B93217|nr:RagB/SusD family nutrient uptake outer membrane protein [Butyricimonas sp.]
MMKMKNIFYIISFVLLSSCNYLDVEPTGKVIPEKVTEFRAMMTSAYSKYPAYKHLLAMRADEVFPFTGEYSAYDRFIDFAIWNDNSPSMQETYPWLSLYNVIFYTNSVIDDVMSADVDTYDDTREQIKAEALLLRAYSHFELLNLYAVPYNPMTAVVDRGIPLSTKIDIEQNFIPAKVEEVYTQILSDIEEARDLLQIEEQPANIRYRFSKKSALALEARVRLYHAEWDNALALAEELIPMCQLENLNDASAISPYEVSSKEAILSLERVVSSAVATETYVLPNLKNQYNMMGDLRVSRYFLNTDDALVPNKCNSDNMKVTFRSAEIYLIAAEAAAHVNGKLDIAKTRLKELMKNRLAESYYSQKASEIDGMSQEALITEIADERARELALEGHRWYDLRRTTRPEIVKTYKNQEGITVTKTLMQDDSRYTISFPSEATTNNPNLKN